MLESRNSSLVWASLWDCLRSSEARGVAQCCKCEDLTSTLSTTGEHWEADRQMPNCPSASLATGTIPGVSEGQHLKTMKCDLGRRFHELELCLHENENLSLNLRTHVKSRCLYVIPVMRTGAQEGHWGSVVVSLGPGSVKVPI